MSSYTQVDLELRVVRARAQIRAMQFTAGQDAFRQWRPLVWRMRLGACQDDAPIETFAPQSCSRPRSRLATTDNQHCFFVNHRVACSNIVEDKTGSLSSAKQSTTLFPTGASRGVEKRIRGQRACRASMAFLLDVTSVAECVPGGELLEKINDRSFKGRISVKLGPVLACVRRHRNISPRSTKISHCTRVEAQGTDKKGRGTAQANVAMRLIPNGTVTKVLDCYRFAACRISRAIWARSGLIAEVSQHLVDDFSANLNRRIDIRSPAEQRMVPIRRQRRRTRRCSRFRHWKSRCGSYRIRLRDCSRSSPETPDFQARPAARPGSIS